MMQNNMHISCSRKYNTTCSQAVRENINQHAHKLLQKTESNVHINCFRKHETLTTSPLYTGLFISPSGTSELDCATTKTDPAERSISMGRESLKIFFCTRGLDVLPGSTARG